MNKKWDIERIRNFVESETDCKLLSDCYEGYTHKLEFECNCGNVFEKSWNKFNSQKQRRCQACSRKQPQKDFNIFQKEVYELVGDEYTFSSYDGANVKTLVTHNTCGNVYGVSPSKFITSSRRCPRCNGGVIKTEAEFINQMHELFADEFNLVGRYIGARNNISLKHNACGHIFEVTPDNFLNKHSGCPSCSCSHGERRVYTFLKRKGVVFKFQFEFVGLKRRKFDFVVKKNDRLIAIEYDGEQHFAPVKYFGGEDKFKRNKKSDEEKNKFCKENNIELVRIPYWQFDEIETILEDAIL